jgi:hypothetical protein
MEQKEGSRSEGARVVSDDPWNRQQPGAGMYARRVVMRSCDGLRNRLGKMAVEATSSRETVDGLAFVKPHLPWLSKLSDPSRPSVIGTTPR